MKMEHPQMIDTRSATLELVSDALVELRFKPDVKLDAEGMSEIVHAKRALLAGKNMDVLAILPPEFDFALNVLSMDHSAVNGGCGGSQRLALAAQSTFIKRIAGIYFRYHPRQHATGIFLSEADARGWLETSLPEPSAS
jgi:hypothetical protein